MCATFPDWANTFPSSPVVMVRLSPRSPPPPSLLFHQFPLVTVRYRWLKEGRTEKCTFPSFLYLGRNRRFPIGDLLWLLSTSYFFSGWLGAPAAAVPSNPLSSYSSYKVAPILSCQKNPFPIGGTRSESSFRKGPDYTPCCNKNALFRPSSLEAGKKIAL